jgi:uncharacterized protein DUF4157
MAETISTKIAKSEPKTEGGRRARESASQPSFGLEAQILQLQGAIGNRAVTQLLGLQVGPTSPQAAAPVIQTKLAISSPGDKYEREADHIADTVMRMKDPKASPSQSIAPYSGASIQRKCAGCEAELPRDDEPVVREEEEGSSEVAVDGDMPKPDQVFEEQEEAEKKEEPVESPSPDDLLQRMCASCEEEKTLQAKEAPGQAFVNPVVHDFNGGGQPLNESARSFFEPRFGYAFDKVRVHTGGRATESARAVNALAYTRGHDIVFAPGQYAPETVAGQRLLAHELTHVMQQNPSHYVKGSTLPDHSPRIQPATVMPNMLMRWHADGPADTGLNTIVCNGKGGIRVQLGGTGTADQTTCLSACMRVHEQSHRADALAANKDVCKEQTDGTQVVFNGEQKASEVKASNAEITCLKGKAKTANATCKPIIKERIKQMKAYRDSF